MLKSAWEPGPGLDRPFFGLAAGPVPQPQPRYAGRPLALARWPLASPTAWQIAAGRWPVVRLALVCSSHLLLAWRTLTSLLQQMRNVARRGVKLRHYSKGYLRGQKMKPLSSTARLLDACSVTVGSSTGMRRDNIPY